MVKQCHKKIRPDGSKANSNLDNSILKSLLGFPIVYEVFYILEFFKCSKFKTIHKLFDELLSISYLSRLSSPY